MKQVQIDMDCLYRVSKKRDLPKNSIYNLCRHQNQPQQQQPELFNRRTSPSPIRDRTSVKVQDGWYGPVLQRTRAAPRKCFGKLEISPMIESPQHPKPQIQTNINRESSFNKKDGWIEIPIQRL